MGNCSKVALREIEPVRITRDPPMLSVNMRAINGRKTLVRMTARPARVERRIFSPPELFRSILPGLQPLGVVPMHHGPS
jgi:hypothetical protein